MRLKGILSQAKRAELQLSNRSCVKATKELLVGFCRKELPLTLVTNCGVEAEVARSNEYPEGTRQQTDLGSQKCTAQKGFNIWQILQKARSIFMLLCANEQGHSEV